MTDHPLAGLQPALVFDYFYRITQIPRPSKKEGKIRTFVIETARRLGREYREDAAGNIVIVKPASPGLEQRPTVVLQGHLDMVCQNIPNVKIDFDNDPIQPRVDGDYVKATGTTLGADNGIAVAAMLALLEDPSAVHGPLELLFTIDEETGLTGALKLDPKIVKGRILLNLDSEEEGVLFIGCAGGKDASITFPAKWKKTKPGFQKIMIRVEGGVGGHSGMDIHLGRSNANKVLTRILWDLHQSFRFRLVDIQGGSVRNAIPRDATAHIAMKSERVAEAKKHVSALSKRLKSKYQTTDPDLKITFTESAETDFLSLKRSRTVKLLHLLKALPNGVLAMSKDIAGLVETSCNIGTIETTKTGIVIGSNQRSSEESEKRDLVDQIRAAATLAGADIKESDGYPGWKPNPQSKLLGVTKKVFKEIYGKTPKVTAIHAGLECGIIGEKFGDMDMISFGPTLQNVHSPDEALFIPSVSPFYNALRKVLETLAA